MPRHSWLALAVVYAIALGASHLVRHVRQGGSPGTLPTVTLEPDPAKPAGGGAVTVAYRRFGSEGARTRLMRPPVVVLHGSPGGGADLVAFGRALAASRSVLIPDLPGSGESSRDVDGYSYRAQAARVERWLDALRIERAHVVGFSMGGGVAITIASDGRAASLTLLSSVGVQQMELLGDYRANHVVHGAQLAALWLLREGLPHFGWLDDAVLGVPYARTFFDSDQRPLAGQLSRLELPVLVVHGLGDRLVPVAAAREHARLVPQAQLHLLDTDHFLVMRDPARAAAIVATFLDQVDAGTATTRASAPSERVRAAAAPFDPRTVPAPGPIARAVLVGALALSTFASEDIACVAAGALVAHGALGFPAAVAGCALGIAAGDLGIFVLGRLLGAAVLRRRAFARLAGSPTFARAAEWLTASGARVVVASRFVPGTRVAACLAAGILGMRTRPFLTALALGVLAWTPLIVGVSVLAVRWSVMLLPQYGALVGVALVLTPMARLRGGQAGRVHRAARRIAGWWIRLTHWEFWPAWVVYAPVALYGLRLALRHRSLTVFTAANPCIPSGGFVGESKAEILRGLAQGGAPVAPFVVLGADETPASRCARARAFASTHGLPLVVKPDQGQRGAGVHVLRTPDALAAAVEALAVDSVLQAFVSGPEFGIFYARRPGESSGRVVSLTAKVLPSVMGDGRRTLEALIDDDPRAVALGAIYRTANARRLHEVPAAGETIQIAELGSHCRGAIFLDGAALRTEALERSVERAARALPGFAFGRFDVRAVDTEALRAGRFTILELNGVTSEPTHIYDPGHSFVEGVRTLAHTWSLACDIGAAHVRDGARTWSVLELVRRATAHRRFAMRANAPARPRSAAPEAAADVPIAPRRPAV